MSDEAKILAAIREECEKLRLAYAPDTVLNGKNGFYGEDAEDLIHAAAAAINLDRDKLDAQFPYEKYFYQETSIGAWPFVLAARLFRGAKRDEPKPPLTAIDLAKLISQIAAQ